MNSCEYSGIFKNAYFKVEILENVIYSCFLMSEVMHALLGKVRWYTKLFYSKKNMV